MTATTVPTRVGSTSSNALLRAAAVVALLVVIAVASFAVGRGSADPTTIEPSATAVSTPAVEPSNCHLGVHFHVC